LLWQKLLEFAINDPDPKGYDNLGLCQLIGASPYTHPSDNCLYHVIPSPAPPPSPSPEMISL